MGIDQELLQAISRGDRAAVQATLARGADPNAKAGKRSALEHVPHRRDDLKCDLIEAGAWQDDLLDELVWAVLHGTPETLRVLIERGADLNVRTYSGTPIQVAAALGKLDVVRALAEAGADLEAASSVSTPLLSALEAGHEEVALELIERGASVEATPETASLFPLASAARKRLPRAVAALLERGAEVDRRCSVVGGDGVPLHESTALQLACRSDFAEIAEVLLASGANPNLRNGGGQDCLQLAGPACRKVLVAQGHTESRLSPADRLLQAAEAGDLEAVEQALGAGAEVEARDPRFDTRGRTPLLWAAHNGHQAVVEYLLARGTPVDTADSPSPDPGLKRLYSMGGMQLLHGEPLGLTPLMLAAAEGQAMVVSTLLKAGADPTRVDVLGRSALFLAAGRGHLQVVEAILAAGADPDVAGPSKETPLTAALEADQRACARRLVEAGASLKATCSGATPIMLAAENADAELIALLLDRKAHLRGTKRNAPPLARAVGATHQVPSDQAPPGNWTTTFNDRGSFKTVPRPEAEILACVEIMLKAGADLESPGYLGTPLQVAARQGLLRVAQRLVAAGANPGPDPRGESALALAELFQHPEVTAYLRQAMSPSAPGQGQEGTLESGVDKADSLDADEADVQDADEADALEADENDFPEADEDDALEADENDFLEADEDEDPSEGSDRFGPELPVPRFPPDEALQAAAATLAEGLGSRAIAKAYLKGGFEVHIPKPRRSDLNLAELQDRFREQGYFVFSPDYHHQGPECLAILPGTDWAQAVALMQTNGCNYDIGPGYIVEWLRGLEAVAPFQLLTIGRDTLAGHFFAPLPDPKDWARQMYEFCPDIVDQGCQTVSALARELKKKKPSLFFWWD